MSPLEQLLGRLRKSFPVKTLGRTELRNGLADAVREALRGTIVEIRNKKRPQDESLLLMSEGTLRSMFEQSSAPPITVGDVMRKLPRWEVRRRRLEVQSPDTGTEPLRMPTRRTTAKTKFEASE